MGRSRLRSSRTRGMRALSGGIQPFLLWILFSLLTIALIGSRPYVALAVALLGGIAMGLSSLVSYSASHRDGSDHRDC